jgi:hypothetical protein
MQSSAEERSIQTSMTGLRAQGDSSILNEVNQPARSFVSVAAVARLLCLFFLLANGIFYYLCGNTWFSASYEANRVYYHVVTTP